MVVVEARHIEAFAAYARYDNQRNVLIPVARFPDLVGVIRKRSFTLGKRHGFSVVHILRVRVPALTRLRRVTVERRKRGVVRETVCRKTVENSRRLFADASARSAASYRHIDGVLAEYADLRFRVRKRKRAVLILQKSEALFANALCHLVAVRESLRFGREVFFVDRLVRAHKFDCAFSEKLT